MKNINFLIAKNYKNFLFYSRINFFIFLLNIRGGSSYYFKNLKKIVTEIKKNGYCRIPNFFNQRFIDNLIDETNYILSKYELNENNYPVSKDKSERINDLKKNHEFKPGEIKLKFLEGISKNLDFFSKNSFFQIVNLILKGKYGSPSLIYHLLSDGSQTFPLLKGKSQSRISGDWHIDSKHEHVIKGIVFLDDVNETTGGYTEIIKNSKNRLMKKNFDIHKRFHEEDKSISDEDLIKSGLMDKAEYKVPLYGKKGDLIYLDSSNLHRGTKLHKGYRRLLWIY